MIGLDVSKVKILKSRSGSAETFDNELLQTLLDDNGVRHLKDWLNNSNSLIDSFTTLTCYGKGRQSKEMTVIANGLGIGVSLLVRHEKESILLQKPLFDQLRSQSEYPGPRRNAFHSMIRTAEMSEKSTTWCSMDCFKRQTSIDTEKEKLESHNFQMAILVLILQ